MPIYSLTREQKEKLLKEKGTIESEYAELQGKTPTQLWDEDLIALLKKLDELDKERIAKDNEKAELKKLSAKTKKGGKSIGVEPSVDGEYVEPVVTADQKKKILQAAQPKGTKAKREPKVKAEPKVKKEKKSEVKTEKADSDDEIAKIKKKNGKMAWETDSDDDSDGNLDSDSDSEVMPTKPAAPGKKRGRAISSDAGESVKPMTKKPMKQATIKDSFKPKTKPLTSKISDSDDSDMAPVKPSAKAKSAVISDSDEEVAKPKKQAAKKTVAKKPAAKKKVTAWTSDSEEEIKPKKAKGKLMDSGSDFDDGSDSDAGPSLAARAKSSRGGGKRVKKYNFSSDSD